MAPKHVLYIQHAKSLGGSTASLRYTLEGLDPERYRPTVALAQPTSEVRRFYHKAGIPTVDCPGLGVWNHVSTVPRPLYNPQAWLQLARVGLGWQRTVDRTLALVERLQPDLVHLNASVLLPSAQALAHHRVPTVWHVRDHPPPECIPWRRQLFRRAMTRFGHPLIFLSEADKSAWLGDLSLADAAVVYNFVNFQKYDRRISQKMARQRFGIDEDAQVVLYVGGLAQEKGIFVLLQALARLTQRHPKLVCLAPNTRHCLPRSWPLWAARAVLPKLGWGTTAQRAERSMDRLGLRSLLQRLPFVDDMPGLLAAADMVVFPATVPHFARPVVEAAAMGKPAIASSLPGLRELIVHGETGFLCDPSNADALAENISELCTHAPLRTRLGQAAYQRATKLFDAQTSVQKIMALYDRRLRPGNDVPQSDPWERGLSTPPIF